MLHGTSAFPQRCISNMSHMNVRVSVYVYCHTANDGNISNQLIHLSWNISVRSIFEHMTLVVPLIWKMKVTDRLSLYNTYFVLLVWLGKGWLNWLIKRFISCKSIGEEEIFHSEVSTKTMEIHHFLIPIIRLSKSHWYCCCVLWWLMFCECRCKMQRGGVCWYRQGMACQPGLITAHWPLTHSTEFIKILLLGILAMLKHTDKHYNPHSAYKFNKIGMFSHFQVI